MNDIISLAQVRPPRLIGLAVGLAIILVAALHYLFVVPPMDYVNKDFMTFWAGSRAVLDGVNPFDEAVWRPLRAAYGSSWMPNPRSPYPLWTSLAFIPFALLPVPAAAALWLTIQEFLLVATAVVLLRLYARRQFGSLEIIVAGLVAFASVAMILVLINGQMTLFMLFVLALFLYHYEKGNLLAAGVTLALLTLKPNPFIGFLPLVGLWLFWKRERRVIAGGALASFAMLVATWAIVPG